MTGVIALIVALAAATAVGATVRRRSGKIKYTSFAGTDDGDSSADRSPAGDLPAERELLTEKDLGAPLGEGATLVQFSTEFCAYCGPTREVLAGIAAELPGVAVVEIDAADRMDLTRRLRVFGTPTVFVLDRDGTIAARSTGKPDKPALRQAALSVRDKGAGS